MQEIACNGSLVINGSCGGGGGWLEKLLGIPRRTGQGGIGGSGGDGELKGIITGWGGGDGIKVTGWAGIAQGITSDLKLPSIFEFSISSSIIKTLSDNMSSFIVWVHTETVSAWTPSLVKIWNLLHSDKFPWTASLVAFSSKFHKR
jgi:hypothetical protein